MSNVVFISGASSGFGAALAPLYAKDGDRVVLAARRLDRIEAIAAEIQSTGGQALAVACDVGDRQQVLDAVARSEAAFGPIDIMIANAGVAKRTSARKFSGEKVADTFRVNVMGAAYCFEAVLPGMFKRKKGHLVGISSLAGYRGVPGAVAYCSSKAALTNMMESLRVELYKTNIDVTTICPGYVKTEMTSGNPNPMPFLLELDDAARRMHRAIAKKKKEYAFPWPMALLTKFARLVPNSIYDPVVGYFSI